MTTITMETLLKDLADSKLVRITGSFADGTQNEDSDLDFKVKEDRNDYPVKPGEGNLDKVMAILDKHGIKYRSTRPGYIFTHKTPGNGYLARQMEFYDYFQHRKNRLKEVVIDGVAFKTW